MLQILTGIEQLITSGALNTHRKHCIYLQKVEVGFVMLPHVLHQFPHVRERTITANGRAQHQLPYET